MVGKVVVKTAKQVGRFVTFNPQKDGRKTLGTSVHLYLDCRTLKNRSIVDIGGSPDLVQKFDKCNWCYNKDLTRNKHE